MKKTILEPFCEECRHFEYKKEYKSTCEKFNVELLTIVVTELIGANVHTVPCKQCFDRKNNKGTGFNG